MGALTKLTAVDMRLILQYYQQPGSGEQYVSHRELTGGLSNSNYRLDTTHRTLLCKVCDEKPIHALTTQVRALVMLQPHKLPIAYPISRTDSPQQPPPPTAASSSGPTLPNSYILDLPQWKPIVLYEYLHGSPPKQVTESVIRQIGAAQAALHAVDGSAFDFLPPFPVSSVASGRKQARCRTCLEPFAQLCSSCS